MRGTDAWCWAILILGLTACGEAPQQGSFTQIDSVGITVAVSTRPEWAEDGGTAWHVGSEPLLDLTRTGQGPEREFFRVADATRLDDGRIAVANGGTSEIRVFGSTGNTVRSVGREGEGPGEYQQISGLERLPGDSLLVQSWPTRVSVLDPDLQFARSFEMEEYAAHVYPLTSGTLLATLLFPSVVEYEGRSGVIRAPAPLVRVNMEGEILDTVAMAAGAEELMLQLGDSRISAGILFGKRLAVDVAGEQIVTGAADAMTFRVFDLDGATRLIVRVPNYPLSISDAELEEEREGWLGENPSSRRREIVRQMPTPTQRPAYVDLLIDAEGNYWAGEYQLRPTVYTPEPRSWEAFDRTGRWLGSVETPAGFRVFEIGRDYILGVQVDSLGVERVQLLGLTR